MKMDLPATFVAQCFLDLNLENQVLKIFLENSKDSEF